MLVCKGGDLGRVEDEVMGEGWIEGWIDEEE